MDIVDINFSWPFILFVAISFHFPPQSRIRYKINKCDLQASAQLSTIYPLTLAKWDISPQLRLPLDWYLDYKSKMSEYPKAQTINDIKTFNNFLFVSALRKSAEASKMENLLMLICPLARRKSLISHPS